MNYSCEHCNASFDKFYSLRAHQNGNRRADGIPQCLTKKNASLRTCVASVASTSVASASAVASVITNPVVIQHEICRRHQDDSVLGPPHPLPDFGNSPFTYTGSVNYGSLVSAFGEYCQWVLQSRSPKFWSLYLRTRHLCNKDQRAILGLVIKLFPSTSASKWCPDKRAVHYLLGRKPFWPLVTYTYTCDLSEFRVPGLNRVTYSFLDPIFAWIIQARKLCKSKQELLFRYREARRRGEQTWGSCVSCGHVMHQVRLPGRVIRCSLQVSNSGNQMRYFH